jgi:hypothetical protein
MRRRMIVVLVAALLALTAAGCSGSVGTTTSATSAITTSAPSGTSTSTSATTTPQAAVTADEYDVYSALIQSVYIAKPKPIVITPMHDNNYFFGQAVGAMESNWSDLGDAVDDFKAKNRTSSVLERRFTTSVPYTIVSEQEMASIFSTTVVRDWEKFYAKYPHVYAFLALSRVGFNQKKDTAVLYTEYARGATDGEGDVVLMKKTDGRWTVEQNSMCWMS